jgi:hypothetical protein
MRTMRKTRYLAPALILTMLLGACGGGGGGGGDDAPGAAVDPPAPGGGPGPGGGTGPGGGGNGFLATALNWVVTNASLTAEPDTGYLATSTEEVVVTLPPNAEPGDVVRVEGWGSGGWKVAQNANQTMQTLPGTIWTAHQTDAARRWQGVASSADGTRLVAADLSGLVSISTDGGLTWAPPQATGGWSLTSVATSGNGEKIAVAGAGTPVVTTIDGGQSWHVRTDPNNLRRNFASVAYSRDGSILVAAAVNGSTGLGRVFISTDDGQTWAEQRLQGNFPSVAASRDGSKLVAAGSAAIHIGTKEVNPDDGTVSWSWSDRWPDGQIARAWAEVASSDDGSKLAAADSNGYIHISADGGETWKKVAHHYGWSTIASSADGTVLVAGAAVPRGSHAPGTNQIYVSADGGETWAAREFSRTWTSVAASAKGDKLIGVVDGGFIYSSTSRTTTGTEGFISGGMLDAVELVCTGEGVFNVLSHQGDLTIR